MQLFFYIIIVKKYQQSLSNQLADSNFASLESKESKLKTLR
ncbi:Uncharacterised protein [Chryseobacterium gleum]|uniref:Uncharacterized protein n=2 Tax=Chryseobacterium gleum TaxID=250 RepID=A0A3S4QZ82_CHRGE|nr:hypothetical protein HMPREF0204_11504 [Chryseobacterium gleum ATCC 35910]VEE10581.1 Uncharacterised protein [Chryseobacterium gleum]